MSVAEIIVASVALIAFGGILSYAIHLKYKNTKLSQSLVQAVIDKNTVSTKLSHLASNKTIKDIEETDGFLKFLSDSRDSAFSYIEDVQKSIYEFKESLSPVVEAHRDSGTAPEYMKQVVKSYDDIVSLLPADE